MSSTHPKRFRAIAKYNGPLHDPKYWAVIDDQERVVVDTLNADNRWNADGQEVFVRMIVAAVNSHSDLLAACEAARNMIRPIDDENDMVGTRVLNMLEAAIAKARGNQ